MSLTLDNRVRSVFASVLGVESATLVDDSSPETIESWDSLTHISLMMAIEAETEVQFEPTEMIALRTFGAILQRVTSAKAA